MDNFVEKLIFGRRGPRKTDTNPKKVFHRRKINGDANSCLYME